MPQQRKIPYHTVKVSYGIYIIEEIRKRINKEQPTETDIRRMLLKNSKPTLASAVVMAKQMSRFCKTNKEFLLKAKEETLDKIAAAMGLPLQQCTHFYERINQLYKRSTHYYTYLQKAEQYMLQFKMANDEIYFKQLLNYREEYGIKTMLITYPFGQLDSNLPASDFGAYTDIKTEVLFKELCTRMNAHQYKLLTDNLVDRFFTKDIQKPDTWISIGLFGNKLSYGLLTMPPFNAVFTWLPQENKIMLAGKTYAANREKKQDYAVFARLQLASGKTVIIIGGIEGYGTEKLGEYVWRNWRKIYDVVFSEDSHSVILLYKIAAGKIHQQDMVRFK
jgi:hypothetical protein